MKLYENMFTKWSFNNVGERSYAVVAISFKKNGYIPGKLLEKIMFFYYFTTASFDCTFAYSNGFFLQLSAAEGPFARNLRLARPPIIAGYPRNWKIIYIEQPTSN